MSDCEFGQGDACEALARLIAEAPALRRLTLNRMQGEAIQVERQAAVNLLGTNASKKAGPDSSNIVPGVVEIYIANTGTQVCIYETHMTQKLVVKTYPY